MKVSNTWKPVLSEEMTNTCIPTKSIQIYVEHLQKYSPSRKAVRLFKYNASSTSAANEASLVPSVSSSSLNSLYSRCPSNDVTRAKDLPTAISKLIHIDLKQLTHARSFDGAGIASAGTTAKSNLPQVVNEQNSKQYMCDPEPSNQQKGNFFTSTSKHTAPIIVNNVVYTPTSEKRYSAVTPHIKMFSSKMALQKLSKKNPSNLQQSKVVSTKTVQLPHSLATLRITNHTKKPLLSDPKTETEDLLNKERKDQRKTQIKTRPDISKPRLNSILNNQELPVLNLPNNHPAFLQKNEKQINNGHKKCDLLVFNEQISKFQALHELIKLLRERKRSYPENNFLQQLHKKLKKDKCHFNMARQQKLKELNTSSVNQSNYKENVKNQKQSFCRLRTFCSKVQPYSVVDRPAKTDLCALATKVALSTNFKQNNSEPIGRNERHSQQDKTTSIHSTANQNKLRHYALRGHIKLSSSNGRLFNHVHLKQGNAGKRGFIIDDLKINLIGLEKKIRKYTQKRIMPLCEESKFERNKLDTMSREITNVQEECVLGRANNSEESTLHQDMGSNKKTEFRINRMRKDTSISLPESLVFKKQIPVCTKFSVTKNLENSILVKGCFHDRQVKSVQSNNKDSMQQQNPSTKEMTIIQSIKKSDSKLDSNRKQATRLKNNLWKLNTTQPKDTTSKLKQTPDNAPRTAAQEVREKKNSFKI